MSLGMSSGWGMGNRNQRSQGGAPDDTTAEPAILSGWLGFPAIFRTLQRGLKPKVETLWSIRPPVLLVFNFFLLFELFCGLLP